MFVESRKKRKTIKLDKWLALDILQHFTAIFLALQLHGKLTKCIGNKNKLYQKKTMFKNVCMPLSMQQKGHKFSMAIWEKHM